MSTGGMMGGGTTQASVSFYIMLNEKMEHTSTWVADKINDVCKDLKGLVTAAGSSTGDFTTALGGSGVSINVYSADLDHLQGDSKGNQRRAGKGKRHRRS